MVMVFFFGHLLDEEQVERDPGGGGASAMTS
jgi:hypothetical protein